MSPISGDIWHSILENFVSGVWGSTVLRPFIAGRIMTDRYNAYEINSITGVKPYFIDVLQRQRKENQNIKVWAAFENHPLNNADPGQPNLSQGPRTPVVFLLVPHKDLPPIQGAQNAQKPRNVVRHLNMPPLSSLEAKDLRNPRLGRPVEEVEATNRAGSGKEANEKNKKKWKK